MYNNYARLFLKFVSVMNTPSGETLSTVFELNKNPYNFCFKCCNKVTKIVLNNIQAGKEKVYSGSGLTV